MPWPRDRRHALAAAWLSWFVPMAVIAAMVIHNPLKHTVTLGSYHPSAASWWAGKDLYIGPSGMNYLPHFAVLYSPFHFLPIAASEVLWRLCAAGALAGGLWRLARGMFGAELERPFLWASLATMPLALGALRNGNANALFGGVTLLAIAAAMEKRWWLAIGWMALATALKPLGIVLLLLASISYAPLARRLPIAILSLAVFPFFFGRPEYVWSQYHAVWHNLGACAAVTDDRFADINGLLRTIGAPLAGRASTLARFLAGCLTAAALLWGARRLNETPRALWLYALAVAYLMLFNPMTEANSYVILAPALAAWAVFFLFNDEMDTRRLGWGILLMVAGMSVLPTLMRPWFGNSFALNWHPLMTIIFMAILLRFIARAGSENLCPQRAASA